MNHADTLRMLKRRAERRHARAQAIRAPEDEYAADRRWAKTHARRVPIYGLAYAKAERLRKLAAEKAATQAERSVGARYLRAAQPQSAPTYSDAAVYAVGSAVALGLGYLGGRWWKQRQDRAKKPPALTVVRGAPAPARSMYLDGSDFLAS